MSTATTTRSLRDAPSRDSISGFTRESSRRVAEAVTEQHGCCPDHKGQFEASVVGDPKSSAGSILKVGGGSVIEPSLSSKQAIELARRYQSVEKKLKQERATHSTVDHHTPTSSSSSSGDEPSRRVVEKTQPPPPPSRPEKTSRPVRPEPRSQPPQANRTAPPPPLYRSPSPDNWEFAGPDHNESTCCIIS